MKLDTGFLETLHRPSLNAKQWYTDQKAHGRRRKIHQLIIDYAIAQNVKNDGSASDSEPILSMDMFN